jgi:hypothetical protein
VVQAAVTLLKKTPAGELWPCSRLALQSSDFVDLVRL